MYRNNFKKEEKSKGGKTAKKRENFGRTSCARRIGDYVEGKVQGSGKGFAFLVPDDGGDDLFIAARDLFGAIHGDDVVAKVTGNRRGGGECEVLKVLKRNVTEIVGVFDGFGVDSIERGLGTIKVEFTGGVKAQKGDKVVAKIMDGSPIRCKIAEVLGKDGDTLADIMGVIRSYQLREDFPAAVLREAAAIPDEVKDADKKGRRDFRDDIVVTVDGATSKDFDDAISVEKKAEGYRLFVHIADVAEYVKENSPLDREAMERGTSVYFADRVLPVYEAAQTDRSLDQIITLSSIIEREAANDEERPLVASVFVNRLAQGMKLESCATVQYILKERKTILSNADTAIDSPYNTYRNPGLPVGPIASPGLSSIQAALNPAATDYLYFVAKADGSGNLFSKTFEEHNQKIQQTQGN